MKLRKLFFEINVLPVSRCGWVVVEEGKHVQLEGVVLLPDSKNSGNHHDGENQSENGAWNLELW